MKAKNLLILISGLLLLFPLCLNAAGMKAAASLVEVNGKVEYSYVSGVWLPAKVGVKLQENDMIRTSEKASAKLQVDDKTFTTIGENAEIRLNKLASKAEGNKVAKTIDIKVMKGNVFAKVKKLNDKSNFSVSTPSSVCGVRGTSFEVEQQEEAKISVLEGEVAVANPLFPDQTVSLKKGQATSVSAKSAPKKASKVSEEKMNQMNAQAKVLEKIIEVYQPDAEFVDQEYKQLSKTELDIEYNYTVKVKNINPEKSKVYLVILNSKGEELESVQMKLSSGGSKYEDLKSFAAPYKFKRSDKYSHRYKVVNQ